MTVIDQCKDCIYLKVYSGSSEPDDPPCISCKKDVFEYLDPECEWCDKECELKTIKTQKK